MPVPKLASASQIKIFKYYSNHQAHEAIMHDNVIMKLAKVLPTDMRDEAYHIAHSLSQRYPTVLSPAADVYRVWVDVRCPDDFNLSMHYDDGLRNSPSSIGKFHWDLLSMEE